MAILLKSSTAAKVFRPVVDTGITMERAQEQAVSIIRAMGLDYLDLWGAEELCLIEGDVYGAPTGTRQCYKFIFTQNIGGILENYTVERSMPFEKAVALNLSKNNFEQRT